MSAYYTVQASRHAGERQNPHGGTLAKWYCTFQDEAGQTFTDCYWQRKPENPVQVGERHYGRIEEGEYGLRFFGEQEPQAVGGVPAQTPSQPAPQAHSTALTTSPSQVVAAPQTSAGGFDQSLARDRSITLQAAAKAVGPVVAANPGVPPQDIANKVMEVARMVADQIQDEARKAGVSI